MAKHDTWATLIPYSPLQKIMHLFPDEQLPMRDPFPMELVVSVHGKAALFVIDLERLKSSQAYEIAKIYACELDTNVWEIAQNAFTHGGFGINSEYIDKLFCGPEGYQRTKEVADFYEQHPEPTNEQIIQFMRNQEERWIDGDETPPDLPTNNEDFDYRLQSDESQDAWNQQEMEKHLEGYSVFDALTGRAMADYLNKQDPDTQYELVELEELLDD